MAVGLQHQTYLDEPVKPYVLARKERCPVQITRQETDVPSSRKLSWEGIDYDVRKDVGPCGEDIQSQGVSDYSGYGVMESLKKKGGAYLETFPRKRLLTTLLNFDVAVCVFILLAFLIGNELSLSRISLSLIGWKSVGNSNWYIFVILVCYLAFYINYRLKGNRWMLLGLLIIIMLILSQVKEYRWYNTILCFPAGVFYSYNKKWIEEQLQKHYIVMLLASIILFILFYCHKRLGIPRLYGLTNNIDCIFFVLISILLSMKISLRNPLLLWFGVSLFPLYIYQRLPMIGLNYLGGTEMICTHPFLYVLACLLITMAICYLYKFWKISL